MNAMSDASTPQVRVLLLRHGQVPHHRSDVPLTDMGMAQAQAAGKWFAESRIEVAALLSGETLRTRETADGFANGYRGVEAAPELPDPVVSFALRNPDMYLGGHRINLAEGAAALAAQSPAVSEADVEASSYFGPLMTAKDRVGYWLEHPNPPGDNAHDVARRIAAFVRSCADVPAWRGGTVVAVTHSPVLRAVRLGHQGLYTREPAFLHGFEVVMQAGGELTFDELHPDLGGLPTTSKPGAGFGEVTK